MNIYRVKNVEEAINLAEKLKKEGRYDWFRGQTEEREPKTSLDRKIGLDPKKQEDYQNLIARFNHWLGTQEVLKYIVNDVDAFYGILQHYGIPTNYLDFTDQPGIAGFFFFKLQSKTKRRFSYISFKYEESIKSLRTYSGN